MFIQYVFFFITTIVLIIICSGITALWMKGDKLWTMDTNENIKTYLEEERETIRKISNEIKKAGIINKWFIRKKLGPKLYDWYSKQ